MSLQLLYLSYGVSLLAYLGLTVSMYVIWRDRTRGSLLPLASAAAAGWSGAIILGAMAGASPFGVFLTEFSFDGAWLVYLSSLMGGAVVVKSNWVVRYGGLFTVVALLLAGSLLQVLANPEIAAANQVKLLFFGSVVTSLFGLVGIEQIYRNARPQQQRGIKFLCLGLAAVFAYDLVLYSNAIVSGQISQLLWNVRGLFVATVIPLMVIAVRRYSRWSQGIFMSRRVFFYTTTMVVAGIYLIAISFAAYYVQIFGESWGNALQVLFLAAAVLVFVTFLLSDQVRARARVLLAKHFFERKYDYRREWLRLINTLTSREEQLPLRKRAIQSLAQIINSPAGQLWLLDREQSHYDAVSSWNEPVRKSSVAPDHPAVNLLKHYGWIISTDELRSNPRRYAKLEASELGDALGDYGYLVPLLHESALVGFIALARPELVSELNFEDHDLLKTAGQQIASYLMQQESTDQLAEARQFEAFNRFTAYVMHDLKNAISQQSLVVENAHRHKHNPEFIDDAIETIRGSVVRMRRVLQHLQQAGIDQVSENVDLARLVMQAESQCADRQPVPAATVPAHAVTVVANRDRLLMAICHAIRNSQDATDADGQIKLLLTQSESEASLTISDTGSGMEPEFVRERLFRPFDSTKGAEGMGIGAYQIRETIRAYGGDLEVESMAGHGTTISLRIPLSGASSA